MKTIKQLALLLFSSIILCECSKEDVLSEIATIDKCENLGGEVLTRSLGTYSVAAKGGVLFIQNTKWGCTAPHTHSISKGCRKREVSSSQPQWAAVRSSYEMGDYIYSTIDVKPNTSFMSRQCMIGDARISQEGGATHDGNQIVWETVKSQYSIVGPRGSNGDVPETYTVTGPYLSSDIVRITWGVDPTFYVDDRPIGGGIITGGQGEISVNILFSQPDCGGIVRVHIEPKKDPSKSFYITYKVTMK